MSTKQPMTDTKFILLGVGESVNLGLRWHSIDQRVYFGFFNLISILHSLEKCFHPICTGNVK